MCEVWIDWCGEENDVEEVKVEDDCVIIHSAQLRFTRTRIPIGEVDSLLKTKAFRDFQILHRSNTTLDNWGY